MRAQLDQGSLTYIKQAAPIQTYLKYPLNRHTRLAQLAPILPNYLQVKRQHNTRSPFYLPAHHLQIPWFKSKTDNSFAHMNPPLKGDF